MQWDNSPNAGFSTVQPWMKLNSDHTKRNVAAQDTDPTSMLNFTRRLITLRRANPALVRGDFIPLELTSPRVMAYMRKDHDQMVLVLLNFSGQPTKWRSRTLPGDRWKLLLSTAREGVNVDIDDINLASYEVCIFVSDIDISN
jgi:glycosidase